MKLGLDGKRALVTGGSKGIGAGIGRALAREGCQVVLVARGEDDLRRSAADIGADAAWMTADLTASGEVERVAAAFPDIDILVNNAGAIPFGGLDQIDEARWRAGWELKVFGYINMTRLYYAAMKARGGGVIVNVIGPQVHDAAYICGAVGNAALDAFTLALGATSHKDGIRVVAVGPGPVATERLAGFPHAEARTVYGRPAKVEEIADVVAFVASPRAHYLTGTLVNVDGGLSHRPPS